MSAAHLKRPRRTRIAEPAGRLTLRLGKDLRAFLTAEAGKAGLATGEYVRNLIVRGMHARELQGASAEIRAMLSELRAPGGEGTQDLALEALLEVRAMLRAIAAVRDPLIVSNARAQAQQEVG